MLHGKIEFESLWNDWNFFILNTLKLKYTIHILNTTIMRFFKYLFIIALFIGCTPLLTSCSNDDDEASPIEGYWYVRNDGYYPVSYVMWVFKNGK